MIQTQVVEKIKSRYVQKLCS